MKILIEPLLNGKPHEQIVQAKRFSLGLKISNLDNAPSSQFNITQISFKSAENSAVMHDCDKQTFIVKQLNPNEVTILNIGDYGYPGHGLINISLSATTESGSISFLQKDPYSSKISEVGTNNTWTDFWFVKSNTNFLQERTNNIMLWLTSILLFLTVLQIFKLFESEIKYLLQQVKIDSSDSAISVLSITTALITTILINAQFLETFKNKVIKK